MYVVLVCYSRPPFPNVAENQVQKSLESLHTESIIWKNDETLTEEEDFAKTMVLHVYGINTYIVCTQNNSFVIRMKCRNFV
jgi:hypothetical protein